jgi:hypothetical protein
MGPPLYKPDVRYESRPPAVYRNDGSCPTTDLAALDDDDAMRERGAAELLIARLEVDGLARASGLFERLISIKMRNVSMCEGRRGWAMHGAVPRPA